MELLQSFNIFDKKKTVGVNTPWIVLSFIITTIVLIPVLMIFSSSVNHEPGVWNHLKAHVLPELLKNTFILSSGVMVFTLILGVTLAYVVSMCEFPGRKFFSWALLLPLSMPAYVMAFVYTGLLDFSGPVRTFLRVYLPGIVPYIPEVRSAWGVIMVMTFALYPYVFMMASGGFSSLDENSVEAGKSLGQSNTSVFFRITLPMARPWIFAGLILVLMETLADFGTVSIFNYNTFTTAIYKAWFGFFSLGSASRLSTILILIVLIVIFAEYSARKKMRFYRSRSQRVRKRIKLKGGKAIAATIYSTVILLAAFIVPVMQLLFWTISSFSEEFSVNYFRLLEKSILLSLSGAGITILCAVIISYSERINKTAGMSAIARLSTIGYSLPGTVLAVGMVTVIAAADNLIISLNTLSLINIEGQIIQGSVVTMIVAYMVRFLSAGYGSVSSSLGKITPSMDEAAKTMGKSGLKILTTIHFPLIKKGVLTGFILIFVEIMKEMPITLMTRPFGWDTLAVKIFELTSEGEWERAAIPAIGLVAAGLLPVILLTKQKGD